MMHRRFLLVLAVLTFSARAAEIKFDFSEYPQNETPPGFHSTVAAEGEPGDWKVIMDEVPPVLAPLTPQAPVVTRRAVLAQLSQQAIDNHYPILVYDGEVFGDFTLTTKFKIVSGVMEQMAGIVFRYQNQSNFYVVRASALGHNLRCYKVTDGQLGTLIGPEMNISTNEWHELSLECSGNRIVCELDGTVAIKLVDNTSANAAGKIGFWTKSDAVSYFYDTKINFTPREIAAHSIVREILEKYPRLLGLKLYAKTGTDNELQVIAGNDEHEIGKAGGKVERDVLTNGHIYCAKTRESVAVMLPLRDRNGDPMAVVCVTMKSFLGQTEQNAIARALPIIKEMQARAPSRQDLFD